MRKHSPKPAVFTFLAIVVGCFAAATLPAQDFNPSVLDYTYSSRLWQSENHDDAPTMEAVHNAMLSVVKVRARLNGEVMWFGSACCFAKDGNNLFFLSNSHVCEDVGSEYTIEILALNPDGHSEKGWYVGEVVKSVMGTDLDAAVIRIASGKTLSHIKPIPFSDEPVYEGKKINLVNCGSARGVQFQRGTIHRLDEGVFYYTPKSVGGCSGSPILSRDCERIIGLVAWTFWDYSIGRQAGIAQNVSTVKEGLRRTNCSDQLFKRLRPRIPKFPSQPISPPKQDPIQPDFNLDDLLDNPEMPSEPPVAPDSPSDDELEAELDDESLAAGRPLRDLLDRILGNQDKLIDGQKRDDGMIGGLYHQIGMMKFMMTWMWRVCLIVLAIGIAGLFLGNGFLTRFSLTFFRVIIRGFSSAFAVISDAFSTTPKNGQSVEEQLRELREKIQGDIKDEG